MLNSETPPARHETIATASPDAPWIVMVHGVSQDHRVFNRQVEAFQADYRLLLIDLPGHGLSSDMPGPYGLREFASSLDAVLLEQGIEKAHFWGTHLGAGAGLLLACEKPEIFTSLILDGPVFPGRPLPAVNTMLARLLKIARTDGIDAAREAWWHEGDWFAVMRAHPIRCRAAEQRAIINDFTGGPWLDAGLASRPIAPIDDALAGLRMPVLIMNGEHDVADFVTAAAALEMILPNCRRVEIKDAGGFPLWEFPERVNAIARAFLDGD